MTAEADEPTDEQLAVVLLRALAAFVTLLLAGGIVAAAGRLTDPDEQAGDVTVADTGTPSRLLTVPNGVGPSPGAPVTAFSAERRRALAGATGRRSAIVSFAAYRTTADVRAALDAAGVTPVRLLIALPGGRPADVTGVAIDVAQLTARQRTEAADEKRALERLLPTVTDDDFVRQYRADLARLDAVMSGTQAAAADVVFAAVVRADAGALRRLAAASGVRLVDVAPGSGAPPAGRSSGLRPEEVDRAGDPPTRPLP